MLKVVFLGPPGGGKGSQAQRIAPELGLAHISTGDMLRQAIREATPVGLAAKAIIDRGELVSDDVMLDLVKERITQKDCENGYILDGFPRTLPQAHALDEIVSLTHVMNLAVADDEIINRLSCRRMCQSGHTTPLADLNGGKCPVCGGEVMQRDDDQPETVKKRLVVYAQQTAPLINYYRGKGILHDINGAQSINEVRMSILQVLAP